MGAAMKPSRNFHQAHPKCRILYPLSLKLITWLERSNYVPFHGAWRHEYSHVDTLDVLREAGMVLYHKERSIWVPDVGTYDWIVKQKYGANPALHHVMASEN